MTKTTTIIAMMARKGGVTKTTSTVNLAAALAVEGYSVLIIESDGQGNASQIVGLPKRDDLYSLLMEGADFADLIRPVPKAFTGKVVDLSILSAGDGMQSVEKNPDTPTLMLERFQELRGVYDFVIADTSPGATNVHTGWYYAADQIVLPITCEWNAIKYGLEDTFNFIARADEIGREAGYPAAKILGVLPNRYIKGEKTSQRNLGWLWGHYEDKVHIFEQIRENIAWKTGEIKARSIFNVEPGLDRRLSISAREARKEFAPFVQYVIALAQPEVEHA